MAACAVALCVAPFAAYGAIRSLGGMRNDVLQWAATDLTAKRQFEWFADHFEGQQLIFVSWPGCRVGDSRLDRFAERLRLAAREASLRGKVRLIENVTTGADVWRELTSPPANFSPRKVFSKLRGVLIGPDGQTSCAVVVLSDRGTARGAEAVAAVRAAASGVSGLDPHELKLAGYPVQMAAVDAASLATMYRMAIPAGAVVLLAAWVFLRSATLTLAVGLMAGFCQALSLALVVFLDQPMSGMLVIMPVLIFVIFISGAVHLINYYRDAVRAVGPLDAPAEALRVGGFPCFLAVATSALGVASLMVSRVQPVDAFALMTSLGLIITAVVLLTLLPGMFLLPSTRLRSTGQAANSAAPKSWSWLARNVLRFQLWLQLICLAAAVFCGFGLRHVQTSMQLADFFTSGSRIVRDYNWLESRLGPLFPAEVLLRFEPSATLDMHDRLRLVTRVERAIRDSFPKVATVSAATFTEQPVPRGGARQTLRHVVMTHRLEQSRAPLMKKKYLAVLDGGEYWRITVRQPSLSDRSFDQTLARLEATVARALRGPSVAGADDVSVVYTGLLPLVAESQGELLRGLVSSFLTSVLLIGGALIVGLRSVRLGVFSTLPNFFPIIIVFGGLGWLGRPVDIGTMMTASIGLGIAVDDTVHFLTWFKRAIDAGLSRPEAAYAAYLRCGAAIVRTTVICGAGMFLFAFSRFGPARQFGNTICWLLAAALVGDLVLLPALLVGPLGKLALPGSGPQGEIATDGAALIAAVDLRR